MDYMKEQRHLAGVKDAGTRTREALDEAPMNPSGGIADALYDYYKASAAEPYHAQIKKAVSDTLDPVLKLLDKRLKKIPGGGR